MRESIGGTWLFGIVITFIALFASFLSYAINYTKAFSAKNEILNMIERSEGYTVSGRNDLAFVGKDTLKTLAESSVEAEAFQLIKSLGYNYTILGDLDCNNVDGHNYGNSSEKSQVGGYCVTMYCPDGVLNGASEREGNDSKVYYKVTTFIALKIPVINVLVKIPVTGETRTLFFDNGSHEVKNRCVSPLIP
jgi:hypothetical protein